MALHTMAILQAYQADVLKEMDEGTGLTPEAVKELRRATDLALKATKHTARAVGHSMAASVAAERHLWLNLTEIREREKVFLMDAPISQSGLFGDSDSVFRQSESELTEDGSITNTYHGAGQKHLDIIITISTYHYQRLGLPLL